MTVLTNMVSNTKIKDIWKKYAPQYYWGDPLDVRFYLCKEISQIKNKKILDVGCNLGVILNSADDSNKKYGFDLNTETIKIAKKINSDLKLNANFVVKDVFKSQLKKDSFDVIILANVLPGFDYDSNKYSFSDCKKFIKKVSVYLKKGGILYLTTPNCKNLYYSSKHKASISQVEELLQSQYTFEIKGWNPFPLQTGHALQYIPGWFKVLEFLMKHNFRKNKSVSFYVRAIKKINL